MGIYHTYHASYIHAGGLDDVDKYVQTQKVEHHTFFDEGGEVEQQHSVQYLVEMIEMAVVAVVTDSAVDYVAADSAVVAVVVQVTINLESVF